MQNKRGQIYIISAIIIILIIVGLAGVTNRATYRQEPTKFYELGGELAGESFVLSAYGEYNNQNAQALIKNFTQNVFSTYIAPTGAEFLVVYGNNQNITYTQCQYPAGLTTSGVLSGETSVGQGDLVCNDTATFDPGGQSITLPFQNQNYTIDLSQNQGYYYVFTKKQGSDKYISQK